LVLFVYCVGLRAGPSFFRGFVRQGRSLTRLAAALILLSAVLTYLLSMLLAIPTDLAAGIFAGAMTSTPGLAAAMERLPEGSQVAVGYGIAYPFGVVGVVLFVQLLPRLLGQNLDKLGGDIPQEEDPGNKVVRALVEVKNPVVAGKKLAELGIIADSNCQVARILREKRLIPLPPDFTLELDQHVLVIGAESHIPAVIGLLGRPSKRTDYFMDAERERMQVVVSSKNVLGRSLGDLRLRNSFGVTVSRIHRHELEFVPTARDELEYGDALVVVGSPENLEDFAEFAGHRARTFDETDLASIGIGIVGGVLLGMVSFDMGGRGFSLGMAGGPLLVALILGHFGRIGPVVGHLPRASQMLLMEIGLVFFLAEAGVEAGRSVVPTVLAHGLSMCLAALAIALTPMILGYLIGRYILKMNLLQIIGGVCGGMTSTPGLGAITAKTDSEVPIVSYAAAYPVALILMTVFAQTLVSLLG
jgi:putative transport protein